MMLLRISISFFLFTVSYADERSMLVIRILLPDFTFSSMAILSAHKMSVVDLVSL